jgi:hypothetical protein
VEAEAEACRNADYQIRAMRWGRLLGLLEAGVIHGYWTKRQAGTVAELVEQRVGLRKVRKVLAQTPR